MFRFLEFIWFKSTLNIFDHNLDQSESIYDAKLTSAWGRARACKDKGRSNGLNNICNGWWASIMLLHVSISREPSSWTRGTLWDSVFSSHLTGPQKSHEASLGFRGTFGISKNKQIGWRCTASVCWGAWQPTRTLGLLRHMAGFQKKVIFGFSTDFWLFPGVSLLEASVRLLQSSGSRRGGVYSFAAHAQCMLSGWMDACSVVSRFLLFGPLMCLSMGMQNHIGCIYLVFSTVFTVLSSLSRSILSWRVHG